MKKRLKYVILSPLVIALMFMVSFLNNLNVIKAEDVNTSDLVVKYKTTNSIAISWDNISISENVTKFNAYSQDQLIENTTDKLYVFSNLSSGTSYNFRIDFLDNSDNVIDSKTINNISPAITINDFNQSRTYPKDTYYLNGSLTIPQGVEIDFEAGSVIKVQKGCQVNVKGELKLLGIQEDKIIMTSTEDVGFEVTGDNNYWADIYIYMTQEQLILIM